jgi:hypothetical protein
MDELKPWARGPFELIRHAESHLRIGSDFDRRISLIGFDNAIEVTITTFLQLHPRQRGGRQYRKEDVEKWLANYHSKLDFFFDHFLKAGASGNISVPITIDEVIWFHNLRNELYHSGNGFVPEEHSLKGARAAALCVFSALFGVDAEAVLDHQIAQPETPSHAEEARTPRMAFLESFISLEKSLNASLRAVGTPLRGGAGQLWKAFARECGRVPAQLTRSFERALQVRNEIVHGNPTGLDDNALNKLAAEIANLIEFVDAYAFSLDILPELVKRYPKWLRPEIRSVRVAQRGGKVFLEISTRKDGFTDESVTRTDLGFIGSTRRRMFVPTRTAEENAARFVDLLDPYDLIMCTDLFTNEACEEIATRFERRSK